VAKTLKEALLEQMATLQERGLAPGELPPEPEEEPSYAHYDEDFDRRSGNGERDGDRGRGGRKGARPRARTAMPPRVREQREFREPRGGRERRERDSRESRPVPSDLVGMAPMAPPRPSGPPRPAAPQAPRPMGPGGGPRVASRSDMLRRNAERIQREQVDRSQIQQLLSTYSGEELDDAAVETFFSELGVETGALPPLHVVLEALRNAGNAKPVDVADQVRQYYRRPRARAAPVPVPVG
jgi:hypothetical protein